MMSYDQWMSETKRGLLTTRSEELKAIDRAFIKLKTSTLPMDVVALADALRAWLDAKGTAWKQSTRNSFKLNGKGTIERLIQDLSRSPLTRQHLGPYAVVAPVLVPGAKVIVFSGHGAWDVTRDNFFKLPGKCSMKFYTMNMRTLSDGLGGDIDRGIITGLVPDQEASPFGSIPDMRLYPPHGLRIRTPDPASWQVVHLPDPVPRNNKNLQIQIKDGFGGGASLSVMIDFLRPAIETATSVTFLWAACRAIGLTATGGKKIGVNSMQR